MQIVVLCYIEIDADELQGELHEAYDRERIKAPDILADQRLYRLLLTQKIRERQHLHTVEHKPQVVAHRIEQRLRIHYAYRVKDYDYQKVIVRRKYLNVAELYDAQKEEEHYRQRYELGYSYSQSRDFESEYDIARSRQDTEPD